jgi:hypothetical protein
VTNFTVSDSENARYFSAVRKVAYWPIVLQNSKITCPKNFAARPSDQVFADPMPCNALTKVAGWKSDQSCDPSHDFRVNAPAPLENFVRTPKKSFATQSAHHVTCCAATECPLSGV